MNKRETHLQAFFESVDPKKIGTDYEEALKSGDRKKAIHLAATYYRTRKMPELLIFTTGDYSLQTAENAIVGKMREVNVDYEFPDGKIDYLFNPTVEHPPVNHEWLWQFNRFYFWQHMGGAYLETKNEKYAKAFEQQLLWWIDQTDPDPEKYNGPGSAWRTIESGIRLLSFWPRAFFTFRTSDSVADESLILMIASMHRQACHLHTHPTGGNWLLMETDGTYTFASLFPEFFDAEELRIWACKTISDELTKQVLPDGFQRELSPDYQSVSFECAACVWTIAKACGHLDEIPADYLDYVKKMAKSYVDLSTPALVQPRTNDCFTMHTKNITELAAEIFPEMEEFLYTASDRKEGKAPAGETASRFLDWAGFGVMREDWGPDASYLCFDVGPLGAAHIHQDKLNINLWKGQEELIFDDGGGQYEISDARTYGLSAYDHNTVTVDGLAQNREEPKVMTAPIDAGWITNDKFDYAVASYEDGFGDNKQCIASHQREVRFCKPDFFVVRDTLTSKDKAAHTYSARFHMDTLQVSPVEKLPGAFLAEYGKTWNLLLVPLTEDGEEAPVGFAVSGQTEPCYLGWYIGRNEAHNHPATTLLFNAETTKNRHFTTLLFPIQPGETLPVIQQESDGTVMIQWRGKEFSINLKELSR